MEDYQKRVVDEKRDLDVRAAALMAFSSMAYFSQLSAEEQDRMKRQWNAMRTYSDILGERIANFQPKG